MSSASTAEVARQFTGLEKLVGDITNRFYRRYGGDYDELLSEAYLQWGTAWHSYNGQSQPTTWTYFVIWHQLLEHHRTATRRAVRLPQAGTLPASTRDRRIFNLMQVASDLSLDAMYVLRLITEVPADLELVLAQTPRGPGRPSSEVHPVHLRRAVVNYLLIHGWTADRIGRVWDEIRGVLND